MRRRCLNCDRVATSCVVASVHQCFGVCLAGLLTCGRHNCLLQSTEMTETLKFGYNVEEIHEACRKTIMPTACKNPC